MHWIITAQPSADATERTRVGLGYLPFGNSGPPMGSRRDERAAWTEDYLKTHQAMFPFHFRLKDDDGNIDFVGQCGDLDQADGDQAFAPLDWAQDDTGSTSMEYRKKGDMNWMAL